MSVLQSSVNWVLAQAKARLGDEYVYGGSYSPNDLSQGADCSGAVGWVLEALTRTPAGVSWDHPVSTESWYYDYGNNTPAPPGYIGPFGTVAVAKLSDIPADAALTISIMHGGGGADSHISCVVPLPGTPPFMGVIVESNGSYGSCTNGTGAYPPDASLWTDWWFLPGPWIIDVEPNNGPIPAPTPIPAGPGTTYTVQSGDTLTGIAAQFSITVPEILAVNPGLTNPNLIDVGQVIQIP